MTKAVSSSKLPDGGSASVEALKLLGMTKNGRSHGDAASPRAVKRQHVADDDNANAAGPDDKKKRRHGACRGTGAMKTEAVASNQLDVCNDDWHLQLEELKRQRPPAPRSRIAADEKVAPLTEAELLTMARRACGDASEANWQALLFPVKFPRSAAVVSAVRQLNGPEAVTILSTCAARYRLHPRERVLCAAWILQIIENRGSILVGRRELSEALNPLLQHLKPSPGQVPFISQVLSCLGKWRLASSMCQNQRRIRAGSAKVAKVLRPAQAKAAATAPAAAEEASSADEDEEDSSIEDGARPADGDDSDDE